MDEDVLHSAPGELDPGLRKQVTSLFLFPVVHAGLTGVFFLDRLRQQFSNGVPFLNTVAMLLLSIFVCSYVSLPAYRVPAIFPKQKAGGISYPRWPFYASRRACRPTAVFSIQLTWSHTRPASREARCRAAVKPRLSRFSSMPLRASAVTGAGL